MHCEDNKRCDILKLTVRAALPNLTRPMVCRSQSLALRDAHTLPANPAKAVTFSNLLCDITAQLPVGGDIQDISDQLTIGKGPMSIALASILMLAHFLPAEGGRVGVLIL